MKKIISIFFIFYFGIMPGNLAFADGTTSISQQTVNTTRLTGQTRYETAKNIAESYSQGKVKTVIFSTGNNFADALSASVLAHQKDAPVLLVDTSVDSSNDAYDYITQHLDPAGTVYIIGGIGVIGKEFETKLINLGFKNIVRVSGYDRYETSYQLASLLNASSVSTVVISSGESYPDALSIASFAANKGWPILLTPQNTLPKEIKSYLADKKPSKIYITGGTGVISDNVSSEISSLLPQANIERLSGQSRFDTNAAIAQAFAPTPDKVYLTTGYGFADALAGSALAAKNGYPIIFIDPSSPTLHKATAGYFGKLNANNLSPTLIAFGGKGAVSDDVLKNSSDMIIGKIKQDSIYSIVDINETIPLNQDYSLPSTIKARLYNSDSSDVSVKWNPSTVDTSTAGTSVYEGVVDGYSKTIRASVTVENIKIEDRDAYLNKKVNEIISKIITPGMTDLQKELAIHDYIVNNTEYNTTPGITFDSAGNAKLTPNFNVVFTAYGVLINGTGVCEGYADAANILLNKAGIESRMIYGMANGGNGVEPHSWNIVKISGEYYHLDVTWDDGSRSYDYFNLTDDQIAKDHTWDKEQYPACTKKFAF